MSKYVNSNGYEEQISTLIQSTPFLEELISVLRKKGLLSKEAHSELSFMTLRFQKCRYLYEWLIVKNAEFTEDERERLYCALHGTGNGGASDHLATVFAENSIVVYNDEVSSDYSEDEMQIDEFDDFKTKRENLYCFEAKSIVSKTPKRFSIKRTQNREHQIRRKVVTESISGAKLSVKLTKELVAFVVAIKNGNFKTLSALISRQEANAEDRSRLRRILSYRDYRKQSLLHISVHRSKGAGIYPKVQCIGLILNLAQKFNRKSQFLDAQDDKGSTALHIAVENHSYLLSTLLIDNGARLFIMDNEGKTALECIRINLPKCLIFLLDQSITSSGDFSSDDDHLYFVDLSVILANDELISQSFSDSSKPCNKRMRPHTYSRQESETFSLMVPESQTSQFNLSAENEQKEVYAEMPRLAKIIYMNPKTHVDLLTHPTVKLFLMLKYTKFRWWFGITIALQMLFYVAYAILTYYMYAVSCPHTFSEKLLNSTSEFLDDVTECKWEVILNGPIFVILVVAIFFLFKEIIVAMRIAKLTKKKRIYFKSIQNFFHVSFTLMVFSTCLPFYFQTRLLGFQYTLAVAAVLLSAMLILFVFGNANLEWGIHSIYIHVYGKILQRFASVVLTFSALLFAFAMALGITFPKAVEFDTYGKSLLKLLVMLSGEFDYDSTFYGDDLKTKIVMSSFTTFVTGQLLYVLFAIILTLVLIDVFLGYTVSDIQELKKGAEMIKQRLLIEKLFALEGFLLQWNKMLQFLRLKPLMTDLMIVPDYMKRSHKYSIVITYQQIPDHLKKEFINFQRDSEKK